MRNIFTQSIRAFALFSFLILLSATTFAQVGINTTMPKEGSILDVEASDLGIYFPRVNITSLATLAPITGVTVPANAFGLLVYNTNGTTGPGYFYWTGSVWSNVGNSGNDDWKIAGNGNTTNVGNFLGTTNNEGIRIKTNSFDRFDITGGTLAAGGRLQSYTNGTLASPIYSWSTDTGIGMYRIAANTLGFSALQVSVNGNPLFVGDRFTVRTADTEDAINGYATNATGVYGSNGAGVGNGVFGISTNIGVRGFGAHGALLESGLDGGFGTIAWNTAASGPNRTGLIAIGQNLGIIAFPNTGATFYGTSGAAGFSSNAAGTGLIGVGNGGLTAFTVGSGLAGTGTDIGVFGYATSAANLPNATTGKAGGYFANAEGGFAYVAAWNDPPGGGNTADISYKIIGSGAVSTIVKDVNDKAVTMFAPEAPEILFQDYGVGKLSNGMATIIIDPIFSKNIRVDATHPLKVFVQLEGDCNGVYVTSKSSTGFTVKELQNGRSNVPFAWSIVATRADEVFQMKNGGTKVSHNSQRFPTAPSPIELTQAQKVDISANALNNRVMSSSSVSNKKNKEPYQAAESTSETKTSSDNLKSKD